MAATAPKPLRATNASLRRDLIEDARRLNIDVSQPPEQVRKLLRETWIEEHLPAMEACNRWVEENGLPLAQYRQF
jgi:antitoxin CcdA